MATKKAKKRKKEVAGETPITIGGGGGGPLAAPPLTIDYDPAAWTHVPGRLTLIGGKVKKVTIGTGDFSLKLPVNGAVTIDLKCEKP
jgi:hypothetical protein